MLFEPGLFSDYLEDEFQDILTNPADLRQILADNTIRDLLAEEDTKFMAALNAAMPGLDYSESLDLTRPAKLTLADFKDASNRLAALNTKPEPILLPAFMLDAVRAWGLEEV